MTNEPKCSCGKPKYIGREVCYDCYKDMFYNYTQEFTIKTFKVEDDEPDFELKSDVATVSPSKFLDSSILYTNANIYTIKIPKRVVFNPDVRVKDYEKLVVFLLENMAIFDNAKGFDKVSWMFKEYKEEDK